MFSDLASLLNSFNSKIQPQRDFGLCLEEIWQNISPDPKAIYGGFDFKKEEILIYVDNHALISNLQFSRLSLLKKLNHELNERKKSCDLCELLWSDNSGDWVRLRLRRR